MTHWNVIIVAPPLTITREELDEGLEKLDEAPRLVLGTVPHRDSPLFRRRDVWPAASPEMNVQAPERRWDMYIGIGTVLLIILIVLLVLYVF